LATLAFAVLGCGSDPTAEQNVYLDTASPQDTCDAPPCLDHELTRQRAVGIDLWGGADTDRACAIAELPDGFALAGETFSGDSGDSDAWLIRTDPWGHATCADAGVCAGTAAATCDDANPCSADLCDGVKGCMHADLPNGATCGLGGVCTDGMYSK
jgi:hypothetical protein